MVRDVRAAAQWLATRPNVRRRSDCDRRRVARRQPGAAGRRDVPQVRAMALSRRRSTTAALRTDDALIKRLGARSIWLAASDRGSAGAPDAARHRRRAVRPARTARLERRARTARCCSTRTATWRDRWWTGCAARCYSERSHASGRDRLWHCRQPVRPDRRLGARQPAGGRRARRRLPRSRRRRRRSSRRPRRSPRRSIRRA